MLLMPKPRLFPSIARHPFISALTGLKGNPRACVYTEPLWGIPFNLYGPYVTLYMYALGLGDSRIGLVISIGTVCAGRLGTAGRHFNR